MRFILLAIILLAAKSYAQQAPIAIVSANGATKLVNTLNEAAEQAQDNDIIYLPAGNLNGNSGIWFTKRVTVIGVGHHPDSASSDGRTFIAGNIGFQNPGAEGSVLDGVFVSGIVYVSSNCQILRTNAKEIFVSGNWTGDNLKVEQCIIENFRGSGSPVSNSRVRNSIIMNDFSSGVFTTIFENCIFLYSGSYPLDQTNQNTFRNSIFPNVTGWGSNPSNCFFYNNIMASASLPSLSNAGNASNNILGQTPTGTFINQSGNTFSYVHNYRLKAGSPGINAGTDGKDIGIYGGASPYKDGAVPPNPSVRARTIADTTSSNGTLKVTFNVRVN